MTDLADFLTVRHNRISLALHRLRDAGPAGGRPLLYLHGLGDRSPEAVPGRVTSWPGPIWALDFTGHGRSTIPSGGGYSCELLMADVDAALAELGPRPCTAGAWAATWACSSPGAGPTWCGAR